MERYAFFIHVRDVVSGTLRNGNLRTKFDSEENYGPYSSEDAALRVLKERGWAKHKLHTSILDPYFKVVRGKKKMADVRSTEALRLPSRLP